MQYENPELNELEKPKERIVDRLIRIAIAQSAHDDSRPSTGGFFHAPNGCAYVDIRIAGRRETWPVRSKGFRQWLVRSFYKQEGTAPNAEATQSAINLAEARAVIDGPEREVFVRVGAAKDKLYIDLANDRWEAIEVDARGWRVISGPPIRFRRSPGMRPLPTPARGGSINALRQYLNVNSDEDFILAVSWVLAALRNRGPYPVLALSGEQGSAKSTFAILLRSLIDPNVAFLRSLPREERDLAISANNSHVLAFDNISHLSPWVSDALCRIATGAGFATRQLHTDTHEVLLEASRPVILTGIADVVTRADLADRALAIKLDPIDESKRRSEREFMATFDAEISKIFGALLDAIAHGLAELPRVNLKIKPRLADFAEWGTACEGAFWESGAFMRAYDSNRQRLNEVALDADLVGTAIAALMENETLWEGRPAALLKILNASADDAITRSKEWPVNANQFGRALRRCAPLLRRAGLEIETGTQNKGRWVTLRRRAENGRKSSSPSSPSAQNGGGKQGNDGNDENDSLRPISERPICAQCGTDDPAPNRVSFAGQDLWLHRECERRWGASNRNLAAASGCCPP
jgi:hypothetical protein